MGSALFRSSRPSAGDSGELLTVQVAVSWAASERWALGQCPQLSWGSERHLRGVAGVEKFERTWALT